MIMTNYNDGKWHGWNGGECPVHPKTVVEVLFGDGSGAGEKENASSFGWMVHPIPVAFRVVKEHKEPREFWFYKLASGDWGKSDKKPSEFWTEVIHVREVTE